MEGRLRSYAFFILSHCPWTEMLFGAQSEQAASRSGDKTTMSLVRRQVRQDRILNAVKTGAVRGGLTSDSVGLSSCAFTSGPCGGELPYPMCSMLTRGHKGDHILDFQPLTPQSLAVIQGAAEIWEIQGEPEGSSVGSFWGLGSFLEGGQNCTLLLRLLLPGSGGRRFKAACTATPFRNPNLARAVY